ncbi:hypothetical protein NUW54_g12779 [Trametes sanguinea]|uniref:Uncharacterized protein n=1 Tax=Trametes sanguinea TaxID=158606 RepID=A0ACC1MTN7_9APHY|nr:hypothetical protein NUW54_g12779 [Trametes sanguinea]
MPVSTRSANTQAAKKAQMAEAKVKEKKKEQHQTALAVMELEMEGKEREIRKRPSDLSSLSDNEVVVEETPKPKKKKRVTKEPLRAEVETAKTRLARSDVEDAVSEAPSSMSTATEEYAVPQSHRSFTHSLPPYISTTPLTLPPSP